MPPRTFHLEQKHEEELEFLCEKEMRKPSQMIQVLIKRAFNKLKKEPNDV